LYASSRVHSLLSKRPSFVRPIARAASRRDATVFSPAVEIVIRQLPQLQPGRRLRRFRPDDRGGRVQWVKCRCPPPKPAAPDAPPAWSIGPPLDRRTVASVRARK